MSIIEDRGWTLHYTIGSVLAAKVEAGDLVHMPGGQDDLVVTGGRAPARAKDCGSVFARRATAADRDALEMQPDALGLVWISAAGGWAKLPRFKTGDKNSENCRLC